MYAQLAGQVVYFESGHCCGPRSRHSVIADVGISHQSRLGLFVLGGPRGTKASAASIVNVGFGDSHDGALEALISVSANVVSCYGASVVCASQMFKTSGVGGAILALPSLHVQRRIVTPPIRISSRSCLFFVPQRMFELKEQGGQASQAQAHGRWWSARRSRLLRSFASTSGRAA